MPDLTKLSTDELLEIASDLEFNIVFFHGPDKACMLATTIGKAVAFSDDYVNGSFNECLLCVLKNRTDLTNSPTYRKFLEREKEK